MAKNIIAKRLLRWASDVHLAKLEVDRLHKERGALKCKHEHAYDSWLSQSENNYEKPYSWQMKPCWKWIDGHRVGDESDEGWCGPCEKREVVNAKYHAAVRRLGSLKGAMWQLAAKAHVEIEQELDKI